MPSTTTKQRELMAIAEHHPTKVYAKNRGVLKMAKNQLHDYAATKGLPASVKTASSKVMKSRSGKDRDSDYD
jgi:hypothetical protein